jgi:hypothetical protein
MIVLLKLLLCGVLTCGCILISHFLMIPALVPSALTAWGCICFLFSGELAGQKRRIRNGIEDKPPLRLMWMVAGIVCIVMAVGVLFVQV